MDSSDKLSAFPTRSEIALSLSIIHEQFGEFASVVCQCLHNHVRLSLAQLVKKLKSNQYKLGEFTSKQVKQALLVLLQNNLLLIESCPFVSKTSGEVQLILYYQVAIKEILLRLYFPTCLHRSKEAFGLKGLIIMEELLGRGRMRLDESIRALAQNLAEKEREEEYADNPEDIPYEEEFEDFVLEDKERELRSTFHEMAKKRYIIRAHPLDLAPKETDDSESNSASTTPKSTSSNKRKSPSESTADADENGLTVRKRRRKTAPKETAVSDAMIPVELQLMMQQNDERRNNVDEGEQEIEPEKSSKSSRRRRRAQLPSNGAQKSSDDDNNDFAIVAAANGLSEKDIVWRVGLEQFIMDARHNACVVFASENTNKVAGTIVESMLAYSSPHERVPNEANSVPMTVRQIMQVDKVFETLPQSCPDRWKLLMNYMVVLTQDKSKMLVKVAKETFDPTFRLDRSKGLTTTSDGGQFLVHMQNIVNFLKRRTLLSVVQERFGIRSSRIMEVLLQNRQLEQRGVGELAMLPATEVRKRLYELYALKYVNLQEIPKRSDYNPLQTFYCWSVDLDKVYAQLIEQTQFSVARLRSRRKHELEQGKDLIARSDNLVTDEDIKNFDRLSRALDRLDQSIIRLQDMLLLLSHF